jgi:glucosamine-6-phosphate isomerase
MELKIYPGYPQLSRACADLIKDCIQQKKEALVCIASGFTPVGVFECLLKDVKEGKLDLSRCTFLSLDEWIGIDPADPGSCLSMLKRDFFDHLSLNENQVVFFDVNADIQKECDRINKMIAANGGLDVMLVGLGTNGHIGMNEPGTSFSLHAHVGELAEETKTVGQKYFKKVTSLSKGITLGLKDLKEARIPIVMANGEKKAAIIQKILTTSPTEQIPATIIHEIPHVYVMIDELAAAEWRRSN